VPHNLGPDPADGGGMARRLSVARTQPQRRVTPTAAPAPWWRDAVVYQVYLRSFADSDGDGIGDLRGLRQRLPYLSWLGVDAVWINPHYPSGGADGGYDVVDYRAVDPDYGDVSDLEALVDDARRLGLKVVLDVVPNHTSDQHPWFQAALADPDSPEAARYHFARRRRSRRTTGSRCSAGRPGRAPRTAAGTCTCSPPSSPTSTGATRPWPRTSSARCASGWTAA
jgi:Alpha amylase, catalytic domain